MGPDPCGDPGDNDVPSPGSSPPTSFSVTNGPSDD